MADDAAVLAEKLRQLELRLAEQAQQAAAAAAEAQRRIAAAEEDARKEATLRAAAEEEAQKEATLRAAAEEEARRKIAAAQEEARQEATLRADAERRVQLERGRTFFAKMYGMSGSASESSSVSADVARRGAPASELVELADYFARLPAVSEATVRDAWERCKLKLASWTLRDEQLELPLATLKEREFTHPVMRLIAAEAMPQSEGCPLRMWYEAAAEDSVPHSRAKPDLLWTHRRDQTPCSLGACFSVELKRWSDAELGVGCAQAGNYGRRLMFRQVTELLERGANLTELRVYAAASNGADIVFVCVRSGVVEGPDPYSGTPCPMYHTVPLRLLRDWNPRDPASVPGPPPAGFEALVRILNALPEQLNECALPLTRLEISSPVFHGRLELGLRLGCGGSSDVYACSIPVTDGIPGPAAAAAVRHVVKVARCATSHMNKLYKAEATSLEELATAPPDAVPRLLCSGSREQPERAHAQLGNDFSVSWPLLLLSPAGMPLHQALQECIGGAADTWAARVAFGDMVMRGVLRGLKAAHAAKIIHCDVRPANVVVVGTDPRAALLIDYGLSRRAGTAAGNLGVDAYAADCVFNQTACSARAGLDLVGAAFTWISCVYGGATCSAPWENSTERAAWLAQHAATDQLLNMVARAAQSLAGLRAIDDSWYSWPWRHSAE